MREVPLSNCEREFILSAITHKQRLDGRDAYAYRQIKILFGIDRGCCNVEIGNTKVMAQVSCEVTTPKQTRPTDGMLFVNVELSPMASPQFEAGRQSDQGVELTRLLERCLKESRCVDTESLCIMTGIKVWTIRVDVHVLNYDGNLIDASSIAAISALAHFRRPDVSVCGEEVTIHTLEDKDPVPLSIQHMPICISFAFYEQGKFLLIDPIEKEERVMEGKMVIGMNKHREICTLQMTGSMLLLKDQVLRCSNIAMLKVKEITELIQQAIENDAQARAAGKKFGFAALAEADKRTRNQQAAQAVDTVAAIREAEQVLQESSDEMVLSSAEEEFAEKGNDVKILFSGTGQIGQGGVSTWDSAGEEAGQEMEEEVKQHKTKMSDNIQEMDISVGDLSGESEEDETVTLKDLEISSTKNKSDTIDLTGAVNPKSRKHKKKKKR